MTIVKISKWLEGRLSPKRYKHTLGVKDTALQLANCYHKLNPEKVALAALLHDCARELPAKVLVQIAEENELEISKLEREDPSLLHGPIGAIIARKELGIKDKEIYQAIKYHTTGSSNMDELGIIICLADYLEPMRSFEGVNELRELAKVSPVIALRKALEGTLKYLLERELPIHPRTVKARNYLLKME